MLVSERHLAHIQRRPYSEEARRPVLRDAVVDHAPLRIENDRARAVLPRKLRAW
jgi:hypothetical protein